MGHGSGDEHKNMLEWMGVTEGPIGEVNIELQNSKKRQKDSVQTVIVVERKCLKCCRKAVA